MEITDNQTSKQSAFSQNNSKSYNHSLNYGNSLNDDQLIKYWWS